MAPAHSTTTRFSSNGNAWCLQPSRHLLWLLGTALLLSLQETPAAQWSAVVSPDNALEFHLAKDQRSVIRLGMGGWGPNWQWVGLSPRKNTAGQAGVATVPFVVNQDRGELIEIAFQAAKTGPRQVSFRYVLSATNDVPITMVMAGLGLDKSAASGQVTLVDAQGKKSERPLPLGRGSVSATSNLVLHLEQGSNLALTLDPPCPISFDGDMRIMLASEVFKAGSRTNTLTLTFPSEVAFAVSPEDLVPFIHTLAGPTWFAFAPTNELGADLIGMEQWLNKPAGSHGGVRMVGDHFAFEDKTPVKFWGVNLSYGGACAPDKKTAEFTAARFAHYGINGVRLHKFSYPEDQMGIGERNDATRMTAGGLDRLDYFSAQLKSNGVYFGWSHTFGFHVGPGNRSRLLAYDEIERYLKGNTYGFINFAEDVQDLMIEMVVNLLKHRNPYTGLTYAQEPALSFIELQNEDDIFFYTSEKAFAACPAYRKVFTARYCDWLAERYGGEEKLKEAWGDSLKPNESLGAKNIELQTNPWFFGQDNLPKQSARTRQRLLDSAAWLHEIQNKFYTHFAKAIREAGYQGPLCGSPWQAPAMLPHYLNLKSDALVGFVDRHNYFGGGLFDSMLEHPGSGYFSSGLQQVANRPFGLSEWIHVYPSFYSAEGPAIVAAYGMGLQGWDASYEFQSQAAPRLFNERVGWPPWGVWEADVPTQLGQYPVLARMLYRGDVREGEVVSTRRVSAEELAKGQFSFSDTVKQEGDIKSFGGSVPPEALAAGKVLVEFTDLPQPSSFPDLAKHRTGTSIASSNGQLAWDTSGKGFFTVNTPGTKGVVGFAEGKELRLGQVTIRLGCPYAAVFLTAAERQATLSNTRSALLCAVARNCNTGFKYFSLDSHTLDNGKAPILLEPVKASLDIQGRRIAAVNVLDHNGRRTGKSLSVANGGFTIDGVRDRTLYYEVQFASQSDER